MNDLCEQCAFPFEGLEVIAEVIQECPVHGVERVLVHPGRCLVDFMMEVPTTDTRHAMIGVRRLN